MKTSSEDQKIISEMTQMFERLDAQDTKGAECPSCGVSVAREDFYCSACGEQIRKPERPKVIVKRITVT